MPTRLTQGSCQLSALTVHTERGACEAELSPSSELTFCLFSYGKGCSSGRFTRSQEQSNEIRSGSVWTERRHRTRRKAGIGLEQRAASPVAGWWAGLALWPAVLPPPPTPRLTSAALPVSSDSPPSRGPESHASQGHEAAGACRRAGTCAGGVFTGAGRRRPALAQSSSRPSCCWTSICKNFLSFFLIVSFVGQIFYETQYICFSLCSLCFRCHTIFALKFTLLIHFYKLE